MREPARTRVRAGQSRREEEVGERGALPGALYLSALECCLELGLFQAGSQMRGAWHLAKTPYFYRRYGHDRTCTQDDKHNKQQSNT